jgi:hypothetical protein
VKPVKVAPPGTLDLLRPALHYLPFTLAGYGMELRDGQFYAQGYRKTARAGFHALSRNWLELENSSGLCYGDSGGPQFLGPTNLQVSLHHDSTSECAGVAFTQRLDTRAEHRFLAPYLPKH